MKKLFFLILITLPFYLAYSLYYLDKVNFLCPIEYEGDIIVRCDGRGNGFFGTSRSGRRTHAGLDLYAPIGEPVLAVRSGLVASAKQNRGMGKYVIIRHRDGTVTLYGHLSKISVSKGNIVQQGEIVGAVGKTGNARHAGIQPHLHFEVKKNGVPQDPLKYLD